MKMNTKRVRIRRRVLPGAMTKQKFHLAIDKEIEQSELKVHDYEFLLFEVILPAFFNARNALNKGE